MPKLIDLVGQRFGRLSVTARHGSTTYGQPIWEAVCDCGTTGTYYGNSLRTGATNSCGCLQREAVKTHGRTGTREFTIWQMMRQRCTNPNQGSYESYGGRGISVCERWESSFENFIADMGEAPSKTHSLDRIDNNGPYSPENCRWATPLQQGANKRNNRRLEHDDKSMTVKEWCRELKLPKSTLLNRLNRMSAHDALTRPVAHKSSKVKKSAG